MVARSGWLFQNDSRICFFTPEAVKAVVRLDPCRWGRGGHGIDCATKTPMVGIFIGLVNQTGKIPSPSQYINTVMQAWDYREDQIPIWQTRLTGTYAACCNGLVVAGLCYMSGKILEVNWSKQDDCLRATDLQIIREDGITVTVGLTMQSEAARWFKQRKFTKAQYTGQSWPDLMLYLDKDQRRDQATNMAWYQAEDIEPILTWKRA